MAFTFNVLNLKQLARCTMGEQTTQLQQVEGEHVRLHSQEKKTTLNYQKEKHYSYFKQTSVKTRFVHSFRHSSASPLRT